MYRPSRAEQFSPDTINYNLAQFRPWPELKLLVMTPARLCSERKGLLHLKRKITPYKHITMCFPWWCETPGLHLPLVLHNPPSYGLHLIQTILFQETLADWAVKEYVTMKLSHPWNQGVLWVRRPSYWFSSKTVILSLPYCPKKRKNKLKPNLFVKI